MSSWKHSEAPAGAPRKDGGRRSYGPDCPYCKYGTVDVFKLHTSSMDILHARCADCGHQFDEQQILNLGWKEWE